ncbi:WD40 repeat-like protein [Penicillium tannophilum]|nr:WD40 repeat-like protein [Penicillium tannophilum]
MFIHDRVQQLAKRKRYSQQIFDAVYSYLLLNAQGTFLWVALVCERLATIPRLRTIEKLTAFPPGLDALYERMMQHVCEHEEAPLCKDILGLVSTTYRPITSDELTALVELPEFVLEDGYESLEEIIGYCGSFLTVSDNTIFFVHQSAKDYLLEKAKVEILPAGMEGKHILILEKSLAVMNKKLRRDILSLEKIDGSINPVYEENMALGPLATICLIHSDWLSNTINILDPVSWESIATIETEKGIHIKYLALSHNGKLLASASAEGFIEVWDLTTRKCVSRLEGHAESISLVVWLRDGRLVSASSDRTIKTWDPSTRQCLSILKGHHSSVDYLLLSADETRLISASNRDSLIKIWDLESSTAVRDHTQPVKGVVWPNDAKCFASYSNTEIKIWDPSTAECLLSTESHGGAINQICWSENGDLASHCSKGILRVWNLSTGQCSMSIDSGEPSASLAWSQDGSNLILASYDGLIKTWDAKNGHQLSTLKIGKIGIWVTWSHDATRFASIADDWSITIQDPHTGRCVLHLEGHQDPEFDNIPPLLRRPVNMSWSRDGTRLASALGSTIKIWDLKTGQCILVLEIEQNVGDFQLHFPRGPMFEESDPGYLHTKVGSYNIEPHVNSTDAPASLVCSPQQVGFGLSEGDSWITHNGCQVALWYSAA